MAILVDVHRHDKFRLDVAFVCHPQAKAMSMDIFWFFPKELDVSSSSYPKQLFYRYIKNNLRYRIPEQSLEQLASSQNHYIKMLQEAVNSNNGKVYLRALKLFVIIFIKALNGEINVKTSDENSEQLLLLNKNCKIILAHIRGYIPVQSEEAKSGFPTINEYCSSQLIQSYLNSLAKINDSEVKNKLLQTVTQEHDYRQLMGMPDMDGKANLIKTVQQLKLLRRYCESVLFLETERHEVGVVTQQVIFSLAAALSMMFAMLIAFWSQQKFGNFSSSFLVAMVLGYIVKDRLKELSRNATYLRLSRYMFDFSIQLRSNLLWRKRSVGVIKEVVQFIKIKKLDSVLKSFYNRQQQYNKPLGDAALMYRRQFNTTIQQMPAGIEQYVDFTFFNIRKMLRNASYQDYPYYYQKGEKIVRRMVQRTYAIELIVRISGDGIIRYQPYTLSVTRKGIHKIRKGNVVDNKIVL